MRLLWVENHAVFARVAGRQFLSAHEVTLVPSLAEARMALEECKFDAVLVDYDLDDGKGDSLVSELKQRATRPVVIAVSAHEGGNEALLRAGADAACPKQRFAVLEALLAHSVPGIPSQFGIDLPPSCGTAPVRSYLILGSPFPFAAITRKSFHAPRRLPDSDSLRLAPDSPVGARRDG
jgi:CheY-like chemotaxis protein